jgi:hypothetical protein
MGDTVVNSVDSDGVDSQLCEEGNISCTARGISKRIQGRANAISCPAVSNRRWCSKMCPTWSIINPADVEPVRALVECYRDQRSGHSEVREAR